MEPRLPTIYKFDLLSFTGTTTAFDSYGLPLSDQCVHVSRFHLSGRFEAHLFHDFGLRRFVFDYFDQFGGIYGFSFWAF